MHRKVFRAEKLLGRRPAAVPAAADSETRHAELMEQIRALRALSAQRHGGTDVDRLKRELDLANESIKHSRQQLAVLLGTKRNEARLARASSELGATIEGMENATETILRAVEIVDESAKALVTILKTEYEKGLAQEIQEQVVRVYEACNFQDLAGQRIQKAIATLKFIEDHVTAMTQTGDAAEEPRCTVALQPGPSLGRRLANGPRLEGDGGHATQQDIDLMFN